MSFRSGKKRKLKNWLTMLTPNSTQATVVAVRSPDLVRALDDSAAIAAKEKSLHAEIAALSKGRLNLLSTATVDAAARDMRLAAIGAELGDLERRKQAATQNIRQHKPAYIAAVRASLLHRRHAAAARVVAAIDELERSSAELHETAQVIQSAGGAAVQLPRFPLISGLKKIAQSIERET